MSRDSNAGFFSGLIVGALIGAAVALLYAPQSGEETRRIVKEKMRIAKDTVVKAASKAKETISGKINLDSNA